MYLDTCAVRALSRMTNRLESLGALTSVVTMVELLDDPHNYGSEESYKIRQTALRTIASSKIPVIPEMPLVRVSQSFPVIGSMYEIENSEMAVISRLAELMVATARVEDFRPQIVSDPEWDKIRTEYKRIAQRHVRNAIIRRKEFRDAFASAPDQMLKDLHIDPGIPRDQRLRAFIDGDLNRSTTIYALTLTLSEQIGRDNDPDYQEAIYNSYDGSAEPYVRALSTALLDRIERGETPAINDAYDTDHFAYLSSDVLLVTDDVRMRALAARAGIKSMAIKELTTMT
jgi:hypothetical protein